MSVVLKFGSKAYHTWTIELDQKLAAKVVEAWEIGFLPLPQEGCALDGIPLPAVEAVAIVRRLARGGAA